MPTEYLVVKLLHIFVAIVALGTSAGLGFVLEFFGGHPTHGAYVLRIVTRLVALVVMPGYVLMLLTGLWLIELSWSWSVRWIQGAIWLWLVGALILGASLRVMNKQRKLAESGDLSSPSYKRVFFAGRVLGGGVGLVIVAILYLMVVKPVG